MPRKNNNKEIVMYHLAYLGDWTVTQHIPVSEEGTALEQNSTIYLINQNKDTIVFRTRAGKDSGEWYTDSFEGISVTGSSLDSIIQKAIKVSEKYPILPLRDY